MPIFSRSALRGLLAAGLAATSLNTPAAAVDDSPPPAANEAIAPLALPDLPEAAPDLMRLAADDAQRMTMPVKIGDVGPYPFVIDTGSNRSIVATELAQRLELQALPPVQIVSIAGRETVASVHLGALKFGTQVVSNLPALSIAHADLGSAGLIGLDGLKDKRLTLDFRKREMQIGRSMPPTATANNDPYTIVVKARSKLGQLILVNSNIDGKRVNVILDTGAEVSVGNMALFHSLKEKRLVIPARPVTITAVTGQQVQAQFTIVRKLDIASVVLTNVPMVFLDAAPFAELDLTEKPSMLLGMKMLRMFDRVAIDFGNKHVDFQLPQSRNLDVSRQMLALR